ncbi:hypothetical protein DYST_00974 [Dyella terrae]|nr:hypothetical protein DYST_00974 [Dyella terrae]
MLGAKDHPRAREPERGTKVPLRSHYGVNDVFKEKGIDAMRSATKNPAQPLFCVEDSNENGMTGDSA